MPLVAPSTVSNPTTGQAILASWGDAVNTAIEFLGTNFPHCIVYNSTTETVSNNTLTALGADSELSDIGGMHSTASNDSRITIPASEGGLYLAIAVAQFAADATGERLIRFQVNGTTNYDATSGAPNPSGGLATRLPAIAPINLSAGDYVETIVRQNSGGNLACQLLSFSLVWQATA